MQDLLNSFYTSFQNRDSDGMISCYHDNVTFEDPAFGQLNGDEARAMWKMLTERAKDLHIEFTVIDDHHVRWEAIYTFSKTGRRVHNIIDSTFEFEEGKIRNQVDSFDLHWWASQALGTKGKLLGRMGFFRKSLQRQTKGMLKKYMNAVHSV